ncbi:hypothetical protein Avbf_05991 [Armadillidium vulgare]|nr:hypothetical protein Avbf_05991 [Armadillidium vulgare]
MSGGSSPLTNLKGTDMYNGNMYASISVTNSVLLKETWKNVVSELKQKVRRRNFDVNVICSSINKINPKYF